MTKSESMPKTLLQKEPDAPLYVRWMPESCPYALEMRMDLLGRLRSELQASESLRGEFGGAFLGALPDVNSPILRLDEIALIPGEHSMTGEYSWPAEHLVLLKKLNKEAGFTGRRIAGFFRSQTRPGPRVPGKADAFMLSTQFPDGPFAFLTMDARVREGEFYLAVEGRLASAPSTPTFPIDEAAFRSLPEVPGETKQELVSGRATRKVVRRPMPWAAIASLGILVFLVGLWVFGARITQMFRPPSNQIELTATSYGTNLKISWDHSSPVISKALGATIVILDGNVHREVRLDSDDLRLGQIAYERLSRKVYVVMRLDAPGLKLPAQTFDWTGD